MDNPAVKRIITLIDMDCFYCQVELRLNPSLKGKPMAVVQYNQWKQGGIIAVNYEARDRGVTRFMRGEEAKKTCPEIELASVPSVRGKADLTRYRDAGVEVAEVFSEFSDLVLRASVDEAFIDLTAQVDKRIREGKVKLDPENLPSTFVVGYISLKGNDPEDRLNGTLQFLKNLAKIGDQNNPDYRLCVGAMIVEEIRSEVLKRTGFHCSAGIAHNKILAKLVAGVHKPKCQTIISHENVPELYETMPPRKVRNLGGKFGKQVVETLNISNMAELYSFSKEELISKFGMKNGVWLYDIARGIDHEAVTSRMIAESIGCSKNFPGPVAITTKEKLLHWLTDMATEVVERLEKDLAENSRKAQSLVVSYKFGKTTASRTCALPGYKADAIAKEAYEIIVKLSQTPVDSPFIDPKIEFLGLSTSKFIAIRSNIKAFMKEKPKSSREGQGKIETVTVQATANQPTPADFTPTFDKSTATNNSTATSVAEKSSASKSTKTNHIGVSNKENSLLMSWTKKAEKKEVKQPQFPPERKPFTLDDLTEVIKSSKPPDGSKSALNARKSSGLFETCKVSKTDENLWDGKPSSYSFFSTYLAKRAKTETQQQTTKPPEAPTASVPHVSPQPGTSKQTPKPPAPQAPALDMDENSCTSTESHEPLDDDWMQICPECLKKIHLSEYFEHLDFHAALKLDKDLNKIQVKTAPPQVKSEDLKGKKSPKKRKRKMAAPAPDPQKAITKFFAALPK